MSARRIFEFLRQWRVPIQIAFTLAVTGVYIWLDYNGFYPLQVFEHRVTDARVKPRPPPDDVVIIGMDEGSFPTQDTPWKPEDLARAPDLAYLTDKYPWDHALWGKLTERLFAAGAREVVFDIAFVTPTPPSDVECGKIFASHADHLVIAAMLEKKAADIGVTTTDSVHRFYTQINDPVDDLLPDSGPEIVGLANVDNDRDGTERRIQNAFNRKLEDDPSVAKDAKFMATLKPDYYSLTWLAAEKALGHPPALDPWKETTLNYYYQARTLQTIPIEEVLLNWDTSFNHGAAFKDKYVFVGATAPTRFKDFFATPWGDMPGVEVQTTAFENLIKGEWLRPAPYWVTPVLAVFFGLLALVVSLRIHSVIGKIALLFASALAFALITQWLFIAHLLIVPVAGALLGLVGSGSFGTVYDFVLERYERRRMLGVFESMVSPGVANLVLSNREDFEQRLGGQRKDVVILFSDIRGFTTWSEKVGPDALVTQLNEYFFGMVEVIQQEGGTVQKYIGDALMAAWGDVREQSLDQCAIQAMRAAWRMIGELQKLNVGWVGKEKREQLGFGIGINLGEGVVGRIGHPRRQEFTVMGDAVNLAARLESATKQYHQTILVGEHIYTHAKVEFDFRLADKMQVMGKTVAVPVYAPLGPKGVALPLGLAEYNAAIEKYYARDFAGAETLFHAANAKMGGEDYLCENFASRCQHFIAEPPPINWDGGWTLKDK